MNLNMSGIHSVTGAFIVNKIIHLLCLVVFSRQCIDLWIAIQNGARSFACTSSIRGRAMAEFVDALNVVCNGGDKPCSLAILYYTNHLSTVYFNQLLHGTDFPDHGHHPQNAIRTKQR